MRGRFPVLWSSDWGRWMDTITVILCPFIDPLSQPHHCFGREKADILGEIVCSEPGLEDPLP
jgi:hypothetical protein